MGAVTLAIPDAHNFNTTDGVQLFGVNGTGPLTTLPAIPGNPTNPLYNPIDAVFSPTGELFVSNRGLTVGSGSIARFTLDQNGNYVSNGLITGNSLENVTGLAFSPSGELFAANLDNGLISRFTFDANGNAVPDGTIAHPGNSVGLAFSPSGELFANSYSEIDRYVFDSNGNASPNGSFTIPGAVSLHFLGFNSQGELFVPNQTLNGNIYRFTFDANGNPVPDGTIFQPGGAIGVAFSPDGEMFATSQTQLSDGGGLYRFTFDANGNAVSNGVLAIDALGGPAIFSPTVPEASTVVIWAVGLALIGSWRIRDLMLRERRRLA